MGSTAVHDPGREHTLTDPSFPKRRVPVPRGPQAYLLARELFLPFRASSRCCSSTMNLERSSGVLWVKNTHSAPMGSWRGTWMCMLGGRQKPGQQLMTHRPGPGAQGTATQHRVKPQPATSHWGNDFYKPWSYFTYKNRVDTQQCPSLCRDYERMFESNCQAAGVEEVLSACQLPSLPSPSQPM